MRRADTFFCWHVEDNHLYATNYVVSGAPKVWYGVPSSSMEAMEQVWKAVFPTLFSRHPDLYYWKTCIFSPFVLQAFGVKVFRAVHEPGTFMFTTPAAYHTGARAFFLDLIPRASHLIPCTSCLALACTPPRILTRHWVAHALRRLQHGLQRR